MEKKRALNADQLRQTQKKRLALNAKTVVACLPASYAGNNDLLLMHKGIKTAYNCCRLSTCYVHHQPPRDSQMTLVMCCVLFSNLHVVGTLTN
jgi:hypothetical protein